MGRPRKWENSDLKEVLHQDEEYLVEAEHQNQETAELSSTKTGNSVFRQQVFKDKSTGEIVSRAKEFMPGFIVQPTVPGMKWVAFQLSRTKPVKEPDGSDRQHDGRILRIRERMKFAVPVGVALNFNDMKKRHKNLTPLWYEEVINHLLMHADTSHSNYRIQKV